MPGSGCMGCCVDGESEITCGLSRRNSPVDSSVHSGRRQWQNLGQYSLPSFSSPLSPCNGGFQHGCMLWSFTAHKKSQCQATYRPVKSESLGMTPSASSAEKHFLKEKETWALRENVSHPMPYSNSCRERTSAESHNYYPLFIIPCWLQHDSLWKHMS